MDPRPLRLRACPQPRAKRPGLCARRGPGARRLPQEGVSGRGPQGPLGGAAVKTGQGIKGAARALRKHPGRPRPSPPGARGRACQAQARPEALPAPLPSPGAGPERCGAFPGRLPNLLALRGSLLPPSRFFPLPRFRTAGGSKGATHTYPPTWASSSGLPGVPRWASYRSPRLEAGEPKRCESAVSWARGGRFPGLFPPPPSAASLPKPHRNSLLQNMCLIMYMYSLLYVYSKGIYIYIY